MQTRRHDWRWLLLLVTCATTAGCASTPPGSADLTGSAEFACGLDDGPATLAHLQVKDVPARSWVFRVEGVSPEALDGQYPINDSARSGSAGLRVCDNALNCTRAVEGTIVVTGKRQGRVEGSLEFRLPDQAPERRTFSASIEKSKVICP